LGDQVLELSKEIDFVFRHFGYYNALAKRYDHLQLLQNGIDVADTAQIHNAHLFIPTTERVSA
jgi:hypothetical protein